MKRMRTKEELRIINEELRRRNEIAEMIDPIIYDIIEKYENILAYELISKLKDELSDRLSNTLERSWEKK